MSKKLNMVMGRLMTGTPLDVVLEYAIAVSNDCGILATSVPGTICMYLLLHLVHSNSGYIFPSMLWAELAMVSQVYDEALFKQGRL